MFADQNQADAKVRAQQRLRLQRFGMALASYLVVALALFVCDSFGFERMRPLNWQICIALAVFGNAIFFTLIVSGRNLNFRDPSLTWLQILYAGGILIFILYVMPDMRPVALMFFVPAFSFGMLRLQRRAYLGLVACVMGLYLVVLLVEYTQAQPGYQLKYQLFLYTLFGIVLTWFAYFGGFISNIRRRLKVRKEQVQRVNTEIRLEVEERRKAQKEKDELIVELREALSKVKTLSGLLPICASCKKIRDDQGYWNQLELYIGDHTDAAFTHSICPECAQKALAETHRKKAPAR